MHILPKHPHIIKPTRYKPTHTHTYTYTHPHIHTPTHYKTHTLQTHTYTHPHTYTQHILQNKLNLWRHENVETYMGIDYTKRLLWYKLLWCYLTFGRPCTVIYSYNKTNEIHNFLKFIFGIKFYMFLDRLSFHHQESSTVHTAIHTGYADCLLASSQHNLYDKNLLLCIQY